MATGIPLIQSNGKFHSGTHIADSSELIFAVAGGLPILLFGAFIILLAKYSGFTLDGEGIFATNAFGRGEQQVDEVTPDREPALLQGAQQVFGLAHPRPGPRKTRVTPIAW